MTAQHHTVAKTQSSSDYSMTNTCKRHLIRSPGAISVVENTPATIPATNNCR